MCDDENRVDPNCAHAANPSQATPMTKITTKNGDKSHTTSKKKQLQQASVHATPEIAGSGNIVMP